MFDIYFEDKKQDEGEYTYSGINYGLDLTAALQLCGSVLDCEDGIFVFSHEEYDGHIPPTAEEVEWN